MLDVLKRGFQYAFSVNRQMRDDAGPRAGFVQFQTYPKNNVQGAGTLVGYHAGKYWRVTQQPQVIQTTSPIPSDTFGGGANTGSIYMQPLIDTSSAQG